MRPFFKKRKSVPRSLAHRFRRFAFLTSTSPILGVLLLASIPFICFGAQKSWLKTENRVEDWIPADFPETEKLARFMRIFGADEFLMASWDGCRFDSPELAEFKRLLLEPTSVDGGEPVALFQSVVTGADLDALLRGAESGISDAEIDEKLRGFLLSQDIANTGVIARISEAGARNRQETVESVWRAADRIPGLGRDKIRVAGSTTDSVSIDRISRAYLVETNVLTYLIGIAILFATYRRLGVCLLVFGVSFLNQQICLAAIYFLRIPFDSILMLAVNLTFVLSLSCCVHLVNYYLQAIRRLPPRAALYRTISHSALPVAGSILTTVVGLLSLSIGELAPIRKFSVVSAFVLPIATLVVYLCVSLYFTKFPISNDSKNRAATARASARRDRFGDAVERIFFPLASRWSGAILAASAVLFVVGLYGVTKIETFVGVRKMLKSSTRPIQDYVWLENNFGPLIPIETSLEFPLGDENVTFQRLNVVRRLTERLRAEFPDSTTISLLNFIPSPPEESDGSLRATARRGVFKKKFFQNVDKASQTGYFKEIGGKQYWRITTRAWTTRDVDYGLFARRVERTTREFFAEEAAADRATDETTLESTDAKSPEILICGGVPLVDRVQRQLLTDLQRGFLTAFLLIGVVLSFVFRSIRCGFLAIVPSLLPCLLVFGTVGLLGIKIELGTTLTASAALGIAVDNAIHFITWFKLGARGGMNRSEATAFAYRRCGLPMFQTTAVCVFGLLTYSLSPFIPTVYFSVFMAALLSSALLGTYLILPAILISPSGRLFLPQRRTAPRYNPLQPQYLTGV